MPKLKADAVIAPLKNLLSEKQALASQEKELIRNLNSALNQIGYQVVPVGQKTAPVKRGRRRGRKPGRKPGKRAGRRTRVRAKQEKA